MKMCVTKLNKHEQDFIKWIDIVIVDARAQRVSHDGPRYDFIIDDAGPTLIPTARGPSLYVRI